MAKKLSSVFIFCMGALLVLGCQSIGSTKTRDGLRVVNYAGADITDLWWYLDGINEVDSEAPIDWVSMLSRLGLSFPDGAWVQMDAVTCGLQMNNSAENHRRLRKLIRKAVRWGIGGWDAPRKKLP